MNRSELAWIGLGLSSVSAVWYIYTIVFGTTRPHRITWGVWSLIGILGVGSAFEGGAGAGAYVPLFYLVLQVVVFGLSWKYGKPGSEREGEEKFDLLIGAVAVVAVVVWQTIAMPTWLAAAIAVAADAAVLWPTLRESWWQPETESLTAWGLDMFAATLGAAALAELSFSADAYPIYLAVGNAAITGALLIRWIQQRAEERKQGIGA